MGLHFLEDVFEQTSNLKSNQLVFILPTHRAGHKLKHIILSHCKEQDAILLPQITTLNQFIADGCKIEILDTLALTLEMYVFFQTTGFVSKNFDEYYRYAQAIINDFSEIDHAMCDSDSFFSDLRSLREIDEQWSFLNDPLTDRQADFCTFWENLGLNYKQFTEHLFAKKKAYPALLTRWCAEGKVELDLAEDVSVVFAGFNAFSKAESTLVNHWCKQGKAQVFWDVSPYYLDSKKHQAGLLLPKKENAYNTFVKSDLLASDVEINMVNTNGTIGQVHTLAKILRDLSDEEKKKTAIVLLDEKAVKPVFHWAINTSQALNSSIGFGIETSDVFQLLKLLFELHFQKIEQGQQKFMHGKVALNLYQLVKKDPPPQFLHKYALSNSCVPQNKVTTLFTHEKLQAWILASACNAQTLSLLPEVLSLVINKDEGNTHALVILKNVIENLGAALLKLGIVCDWKNAWSLIQKSTPNTISYIEGEPFFGVQVMGLLETRALDFDHVILLGAEEGKLPAVNMDDSLVPYELKVHHGIPGISQKESLYAYYFFRLLHRSKKIWLLYSDANTEITTGEKSRFLTQLTLELAQENSKIKVSENHFSPEVPIINIVQENEIQKSDFVQEKIKEWLQKGVSFSALDKYLQCPLDFVYKKILRVGEPDDHELLTASEKGSIIHAVLQNAYDPFINKPLTNFRNNDKETFNWIRSEVEKETGEMGDVGKIAFYETLFLSQLSGFFDKDMERIKFSKRPIFIHSLEKSYSMKRATKEGVQYNMYGIIDRVEVTDDGKYTIIDYKTGKVKPEDLFATNWDVVLKKSKLFQLMFYGLLLSENETASTIHGGIYSFVNLSAGLLVPKVEKNPVNFAEKQVKDISFQLIDQIICDILDTSQSFVHNEKAAYCDYC